MEYPNTKFNPEWVIKEGAINNEVINWLKSFGKYLAESDNNGPSSISTSQIRKFFGEVKKIEADFERKKNEIEMLNPKLAYAVGKDFNSKKGRASSKIEEFYAEIGIGIKAVNKDKNRYKNFVNLLEAIVAFHRYAGGKTN